LGYEYEGPMDQCDQNMPHDQRETFMGHSRWYGSYCKGIGASGNSIIRIGWNWQSGVDCQTENNKKHGGERSRTAPLFQKVEWKWKLVNKG